MKQLKKFLTHPLTSGLDLDDPRTTQLRRRIISEKPFLRGIYRDWYASIASTLPDIDGYVLELGSGAGFMDDYIPGLITSELFHFDGIRAVLNGQQLPFSNACFRAIVMTNVLHHIPITRQFFREAARCVRPGGALIMIEPWVTPWSKYVYTHLHHEPFQPDATEWEFPSTGVLSGANGALPWIIFSRDRAIFEQEFPSWQIEKINPTMPFLYLLSGGVSMISLMPGSLFKPLQMFEKNLSPWNNKLAMFAFITLRRTAHAI